MYVRMLYVCMYICVPFLRFVYHYHYMYACTCVFIYACIYLFVRVCIYACMYVCMYLFIYVRMYLFMYVCIRASDTATTHICTRHIDVQAGCIPILYVPRPPRLCGVVFPGRRVEAEREVVTS